MPPKKSAAASQALVSRARAQAPVSDDEDLSKALVPRKPQDLRKEGHGSYSKELVRRAQTGYGGEVIPGSAFSKLFGGLERMKLMADDLLQHAVRAPFHFEELKKVADSQLDAHMDEIDSLKDAAFFYDDIVTYVKARVESLPDQNGKRKDMLRDQEFLARAIGERIHNAYLAAASWHLIRQLLLDLEDFDVDDKTVRSKIHQRPEVREVYMLLYDVAQRVAEVERLRLGQVAAASEYFSQYFVLEYIEGEPRMIFKPEGMKQAYLELVDLLVVQLALPGESGYSLHTLYAMLHEALADNPKEEKKFSQQLNDAIGDLSTVVQFVDMLDVPLHGSEAQRWKSQQPIITPAFERYLQCQDDSRVATKNIASFQRFVYPLEKTKDKATLKQMWEALNKNAILESHGEDLEQLWDLEDARQPTSQWTYTAAVDKTDGGEIKVKGRKQIDNRPAYDPYERALVPIKRANRRDRGDGAPSGGKKKPLQISNKAHNSDDEPPPLISGSDSDEIPDLLSMSESSAEEDDDDGSDEEEEEEEVVYEDDRALLEKLYRDALTEAIYESTPDYIDESESEEEEVPKYGPKAPPKKKVNPLKRLFNNLRQRSFPTSASASTTERTSKPYVPKPEPAPKPKPAPTTLAGDDELPDLIPYPKSQRGGGSAPSATPANKTKVTVEEEEDIEAGGMRKKKKKKPKKKKASDGPLAPPSPTPTPPPPPPAEVPSPAKPSPVPTPQKPAPPRGLKTVSEIDLSRVPSLPVGETSVQSGQSYVRAGGDVKQKIKTRAEPSIMEKKSIWTRFKEKIDPREEKEKEEKEKKKKSFVDRWRETFRLKPKTAAIMRQIIRAADDDDTKGAVAPMKWEDFLRGMHGMGFEIDLTTAGSSVRFDPPNKLDRPISMHKPHPDPTIQPVMLKQWARRLKKHYGWIEEDFKEFTKD